MYDADFAAFQDLLNKSQREEGVFARFYDRSVKTGNLTKDGLPEFEDRTFVEIRIKDNNCDVYDQPADAEKINRFPVEYNRYLLAKKQKEKGSPLEQFAFLTAAQIDSLKVRGIFTVEALAGIDESKAADLNIVSERELAVRFLQNAKGNGALVEFEKKEAAYKAEIAKLKEKIKVLEEAAKAKSKE